LALVSRNAALDFFNFASKLCLKLRMSADHQEIKGSTESRGVEEEELSLLNEALPTEHRDRDGFRILQTRVELPLDNAGLDPELQTDLLICHLFVNDGRSIAAITHLGFDRQRIVGALLEHSVIQNRRQGSSRQQIA
jgi:hypothetical protein